MKTIDIEQYDQPFIQFYQEHPTLSSLSLAASITTIAEYFLNRPYQFEPLGEGIHGRYSTLPLYRADRFDCVTFTDTVLALAHSANFSQFKKEIIKIRYTHHQIDYTKRTDWFTDFEWNPNLQQLGYIQDVTLSIVDQNKKPVAEKATTIIDKPNFYAQKTLANLAMTDLSMNDATHRLTELKQEGKKFTAQPSELFYIPLTQLLDADGQPHIALWQQFPEACVIEVVRPHWRPVNPHDKQTDYGTHLNISHVGIAIRTGDDVMLYHASMGKSVIKVPLKNYLREFLNDDRPAPIKGINIEKIL